MENAADLKTAWLQVYHPRGPQIRIPIPLGQLLSTDDAKHLVESVNALMDAGFSVDPPHLEAGEEKLFIRHIVRRVRIDEKGQETPIADLYAEHERMVWPVLTVYLNTAEDQHNFRRATGLEIKQLPLYDGQGKLERGPKYQKYFTALAKNVGVIRKKNPRYNPEEEEVKKRKAQFIFVRWADLPHQEEARPETSSDRSLRLRREILARLETAGPDAKALKALSPWIKQCLELMHDSEDIKAVTDKCKQLFAKIPVEPPQPQNGAMPGGSSKATPQTMKILASLEEFLPTSMTDPLYAQRRITSHEEITEDQAQELIAEMKKLEAGLEV